LKPPGDISPGGGYSSEDYWLNGKEMGKDKWNIYIHTPDMYVSTGQELGTIVKIGVRGNAGDC
jgi:hypothetical protein